MKLVNRYTPVAFFAALAVLCSAKLWAEDIEVYYSEVLSDDSVNKNIANVMIMLDNSGSMRNCRTGSGNTWCTNHSWRERRINLLHDAMETILDDADENVRTGVCPAVIGNHFPFDCTHPFCTSISKLQTHC